MDRQMVYPGQIPLETDLLNQSRNTMVGLAKLAAAILGTATQFSGLAVTQTTVASMQVQVAPGEVYMLGSLDASAFSSLAADTAHQILKQGINLDATLLTLTAPGTAGQSVNYLIQATLTESDGGSTVLPYYNSSNPTVAYSGPSNSGASQSTVRKCVVTLNAKAGAPATTGSQATPSPDGGYVGLGVVTVAYGQSSITSASISAYSGAPSISTIAALAALIIPAASSATTLAGTSIVTAVTPKGLADTMLGGNGQSWQDVTSSRALNVTYTNSTGRPIVVSYWTTVSNNGQPAVLTIGGLAAASGAGPQSGAPSSVLAIIPNGATYNASSANQSLNKWFELR